MTNASITYQMYDDRGDFLGERYTETFTPAQTRDILDTMPLNDIEYIREDGTSNEQGDGFYYSAESMALAENLHGDSFSVYIHYADDDWMDYIASREERGITDEGVRIDPQAFHMRQTVAKINDLLDDLPQDGSVLWLNNDGSWGSAADLSIEIRSEIGDDVRERFEIED